MIPQYTGVGSRQAPRDVLDELTVIAMRLYEIGYWARTGDADGCDAAVRQGAPGRCLVFTPRKPIPPWCYDMVRVCWTPEGVDDGGTGYAVRCAWSHAVPVFNLRNPYQRDGFYRMLERKERG